MSWSDEDSDFEEPVQTQPKLPHQTANQWDDEDEELDDWEVDSDEEREKAKAKKEAEKKKAEAEKAKKLKEIIKRKEEQERKRKAALAKVPRNKAEERRQQEQAAFSATLDLFGGDSDDSDVDDAATVFERIKVEEPELMDAKGSAAAAKEVPLTPEQALEKFTLKTEDDYKKLAKLLAGKIVGPGLKPQLTNCLAFFKVLITDSTKKMTLEQVTKIKSNINVVYNAKTKERTNKKGKKKSKYNNKKLYTGSAMDDYSQYDDFF